MATVDELKEALEVAKVQLLSLEARLHSLEDGPYTYSTVLNHTAAGRIRIVSQGGIVEIDVPIPEEDTKKFAESMKDEKDRNIVKAKFKALQKKLLPKYRPAYRFLMSKAGAAIDEAEAFDLPGSTAIVKRLMADGMVELGDENAASKATRLLLPLPSVGKIEVGDQIVHDSTQSIIIRNLGKPLPNTPFKLEQDLAVSFDDIGGLDHIRRFFEEVFILPSQNPEIYAKYGYKPPAGALLAGPPGCGKTLIAKAVATEVAKQRGVEKSGFFPVKGPEILSQWVGAAESAIRELFTTARKFSVDHNVPSVVFIDEAESVMNKRGTGRSSDIDRTIVPAFLTEMDGINAEGQVFVLLATNRADLLDPAIVREGRIDKKVLVPRPGREQAEQIFRVHLRRVPPTAALTINELAEKAAEYLWDERHKLAEIRCSNNVVKPFILSHIASGAMIASVVQNASALALRRDLASKRFSGVSIEDLLAAVDDVRTQNLTVSHEDDVKAHYESYKDDVIEVVKV